jgi:tyrosyl-tRNA synthetase
MACMYTQRKIFTFAELYLPRLGYAKRAHLMNAMVPGLAGGKMSSSDPDSKIDFLDPPDAVRRKIKKAFCEEGNVTDNGVLSFVEAVLIPISELRLERAASKAANSDGGPNGDSAEEADEQKPFVSEGAPSGTVFSVSRDEKYGGPMHFSTYDALREAFEKRDVHPKDLKGAVADAIVSLLAPIRKRFEGNKEWQEVTELAYPSPVPEKKKKKVRVSFTDCGARIDREWCRRKCTILLRRARERTRTRQRQMQRLMLLPMLQLMARRLAAMGRRQPSMNEKIIDHRRAEYPACTIVPLYSKLVPITIGWYTIWG